MKSAKGMSGVRGSFLKGSTWFGVENLMLLRLAVSVVLFILGLVLHAGEEITMLFMIFSFLCSGYDVIIRAVRTLAKEHKLGEEFLFIIAAIVAFSISAWYEGAAVLLLYQLGCVVRKYAVALSISTYHSTVDPLQPSYTVLREEETLNLPAEKLCAGDVMDILPGARIPADGVVEEGESKLDLTLLCGSSRFEIVTPEASVFAGSLNISNPIRIRLTSGCMDSLHERTVEALSDSAAYNSSYEELVRRYNNVFAPFALGLSILIALLLIIFSSCGTEAAIHRALVLLIIAGPSTLLISIPETYRAGLFRALFNGILVKGANVLDSISHAGAMVFDKKDLLDTGAWHVLSMKSERMDLSVMLQVAAHASALSGEEEAKAICAAYNGIIDTSLVSEFEEGEGGYIAVIDGVRIALGCAAYMESLGIAVEEFGSEQHPLFMALNGVYAGVILLGETISSSASNSVLSMESSGSQCIMFSADSEEKTAVAAKAAGISEYYAQCMPVDRLERMQEIKDRYPANSVLGLVGASGDDSLINASDICVCLDGLHSSDNLMTGAVVVMDRTPDRLTDAIDSGRVVLQTIKQNLIGIAAVKVILLLLALLGVSYQLWFAMLVEAAVGIAVILRCISVFTRRKIE